MYKNSGAKAYAQVGLESAVMSASPHQLVVMLFDGRAAPLSAQVFLSSRGIFQGKAMRCRRPLILSITDSLLA